MILISSSSPEGSGGCGCKKRLYREEYYEDTYGDYRDFKERLSVRSRDLYLAELLLAAAMYTVAIENDCFGVILELYVVSESRANVGLSVGYVTANTLRGLGTVLKAGCIAVSNVILEGVAESSTGVSHGVGYVTTRTLRGLSAVSETGRVAVGTIVVEVVTESLTVFYATYFTNSERGTGSCATAVTESINGYGVARELGFTNSTVNYIVVATVIYTVGIDVVFYNYFTFGMTESLNGYSVALELSSTSDTVNYLIVATTVYTVGTVDVLCN